METNTARHLTPFTLLSTVVLLSSACASAAAPDADPLEVGEAPQAQLLAGAVQVGVSVVGNQPAATSLKPSSASFLNPFGASPVLLATPQGQPYLDTFATTTTSVGTTGFNVNLYRTDAINTGWGQTLGLGWLALAPTVQPHLLAGTAFVGNQPYSTALKTISVTFSQPFAGTPRVILTPRGQNYGDTFAVTTTQITSAGFTANVWRTDYGAGWGQSLQLDWMAWDALSDLSGYQPVDGTADVGSHANNAVASLSVSFPQAFSAPPTVLLTARGAQYNDTFSVTAASVTTTGFTANVDRMDNPYGWGQDLHLDWIALPQTTASGCPSGQVVVAGACAPPGSFGDEATVTVGYEEACALQPDSTVQCWGYNVDNQPAASPSGTFTKISTGSGGDGSCGIRPDGTLSCWGTYWGNYASPPSGTFTHIAVGRTFACAIRTDGTIACWGDNSNQQTQAPSGQFLGLAARDDFACGIRSDQTLACWGYYANLFGLSSVPAGKFQQVAVASWNACAIKLDGTLACWGKYGTATTPPGTYTRIAGFYGPGYDYDTLCGIRTDGSIACWYDGYNTISVTVGGNFTQIGGGYGALCAVDTSGHVTCPETIFSPEIRQNVPAGLVAKTSL